MAKIKWHLFSGHGVDQGFQKLEYYRQTDRQTDTQADATEKIITPHSPAVNIAYSGAVFDSRN